MSDTTTIVNMLAAGQIDATQAERLLKALNTPKGTTTRKSSRSTSSRTATTSSPDADEVFRTVFTLDAPYGTAKAIGRFGSALVHAGETKDQAIEAMKLVVEIVKGDEDPRGMLREAFKAVRPVEDAAKK